ncbi:MAG TPA: transglycosylase domain-containing protein [Candidatus Saccharimonadales bacterium]|nr:transglycosylase domain-containing protein [Candidatus Saccharimonadales bacterium]
MSSSKRGPSNARPRRTVTSKSGKSIPLNANFGDRARARKLERASSKAAYLSTLPKDRWKRILYRLHPRRLAQYWFSREGAIMALRVIGIGIIACFLLTIGVFAYFRKDLPNIKDISGDQLGGSISYYDRTGKILLWQDYSAVKRVPVTSDNISPFMKEATVSIEDKDFYKHGAFDVRGLLRAAVHDVAGGGGSIQGGSTITQQLVKLNEQWTNNRTITRKVKELILAVELEREYSKNDILTGYLNIAPYGGVEYGCESAAEDYFHTSCKNLTLPQASMLAAIPQSPSYYSPYGSTQWNSAAGDTFSATALLDRQHYILDQMVKQGYISQSQADQARAVDVLAQVQPLQSKYQNMQAPFFVLAAKQQLDDQFKASTSKVGGWKVITTLDMNLQNKAEQLIQTNLRNVTSHNGDEEAAVGEDVQTGQIVTLVGGTDFNQDQNNFANNILIPPGSSFKPYDYSTLIDNNNNIGAGSVLYDSPKSLPGYSGTCKQLPLPDGTNPCPGGTSYLYDFDRRFPGPITIRYALGDSRNVPAATAMAEALPSDKSQDKTASINKVISTATAMMDNTQDIANHQNSYNCYADEALTKTTQCGLASAIGDGAYLHLDDHVNGLATLARMGQAIPRTFILQITDSSNKDIYKWSQPKGNQVIKPDTAYILDNMASDPNASYLGGSCSATNCTGYKFHRYNGWDFAIKTGTTNNNYDGLMTSWSTKYSFVAWVGSKNRNKALSEEMEYLTEPITKGWMEYAHQNLKPVNWTAPSDIKTLPAFVMRTHVYPGDVVPSPTNDIYPSWYAGGNKPSSTQTIDKVSGKIATSCTPALARQTAFNSNAASWNADIFMGGHNSVGSTTTTTNSTPTATDDVHSCSDSPPSITLTAADCTNSCTFRATVTQGTHLLTDPNYPQYPGTVTFNVNGKQVCTANVSDSPSTVSCDYTPTFTGSGTVSATVTDSVLYSASDSATVNFTSPQSGANQITITSPQQTASGNPLTVSWTGGTSTSYTATVSGNNFTSSPCTGTSSCSIDMSGAVAGQTYTVTVTDGSGEKGTKQFTYTSF